jgi:hypothetical protein
MNLSSDTQNSGGSTPGNTGTIRATGTGITSGYGSGASGTIHATGPTIGSGFGGAQALAMSVNPGDPITLNGTSYRYERVIAKSTGESEIFLLSGDSGLCVFKLYYPNFRPKDDILRQLKDLWHPDIINLIDYGYLGDRFFELMEYAEGGTLEQHLPIRDMGRLRIIVQQIMNAFAFFHDKGIVHKDIKPANLYFRSAEGLDLVIGDFGISTALDVGVSRHLTSQSLTVGYAAPEMYGIGGRVYVGREVDYYAFGITLIHLWQGASPFEGFTIHAIANLTNSGTIKIPDDMPANLRTLVRGLLTIDFGKRWGQDEVRRWLAGEDVPVHAAAAQPAFPPFRFDVDMEARTPAELARLIKMRADRGRKLLYSGKLSAWINLVDAPLAILLDQVVETEYPRNQAAGLQKTIYLLDPDEPFLSIGGVACRTASDLAAALERHGDYYEQQLSDPWHAFYLFLEAHDAGDQASTFRTYYKTFSHKRALNAIILALSDSSSVWIAGEEVSTPEAVLRFHGQEAVVKELKDRDSRLSVWMDAHAEAKLKQQLEEWRTLEVCDSTTLSFVSTSGDGVPKLSVGQTSFSYVDLRRPSSTTAQFEIRNDGGGHLSGTVMSDRPWLVVDQAAIDPAKRSQIISFTLSTAAMPYGKTDRATIEVRTNVGRAAVVVDLKVEDGVQAIERFRNIATATGALLGALLGAAAHLASERFGVPDSTLTVGLLGVGGAACFAWLRRRRWREYRAFVAGGWSPIAILVVGIAALAILMKYWPPLASSASWAWLFMTGAYVFSPRALQFHQGRYKLDALIAPITVGPNTSRTTRSATGVGWPGDTGKAILSVVGGASGAIIGTAVGQIAGIVGFLLVFVPAKIVFGIVSLFVSWDTSNAATRVGIYTHLGLWFAVTVAGALRGARWIRDSRDESRPMITGAMAMVACALVGLAWIKQDFVTWWFNDLRSEFNWNRAWDCGWSGSLSVWAGNEEYCSLRLDSSGTLYFKGQPMKPAMVFASTPGASMPRVKLDVFIDRSGDGRYILIDARRLAEIARYVGDTQMRTITKVTTQETATAGWRSPKGEALAFISVVNSKTYLNVVWLPDARVSTIEIWGNYRLAEATWVNDTTFRLGACPPRGCTSPADRNVWTVVAPKTLEGTRNTLQN